MSEAKCPECDLAQHRGDCFDDEIDALSDGWRAIRDREALRLSKSLRAEGERLRAHGGGSITYVERCDSCETFRQRMIAEKARAEKAERERDAFMAERDDYVDGWAKQKARAEKAERERDEAGAQLLAVREFSFKDGDLDAAFVGEGAAAIAMTLVGFYREQRGENYVEMQLGDKKTGERFTVTVQRVAGKTPHELRGRAEARAETLAAALREIQEGKGPFDRDNHKFACNVIESMKAIAALALADGEEK